MVKPFLVEIAPQQAVSDGSSLTPRRQVDGVNIATSAVSARLRVGMLMDGGFPYKRGGNLVVHETLSKALVYLGPTSFSSKNLVRMIYSSSSFVASSFPVLHNVVKSIIFKSAELLMDLFIFKLCSLIAAKSDLLTSYFMFAEDYVQRWLFLSSRGLSRAGLLVLLFSLLSILSSLYSTLLWGLDSPGYIFKEHNASISNDASPLNDDSPYVIQLNLNPNSLNISSENLAQVIGSNVFKPGINYTLTGQVDRGTPETFAATRQDDVGARIWLDADSFSVSADTIAMIPVATQLERKTFPAKCVSWKGGRTRWNCTFNNSFSESILTTIVGRPEIHWDDASDSFGDSRYLTPSRRHNMWASIGAAIGPAVMKQVFTVTKGARRHTFLESTEKVTMLTNPSISFAREEEEDLIRRNWSRNETERPGRSIDNIVDGMMKAQEKNASFFAGLDSSANGNRTVLQSGWGLFTVEFDGEEQYSVIQATRTNITLLRSETLPTEVSPFKPCDEGSFQNEAFGGKVTQTDCTGAKNSTTKAFFGQVDTSAVLIMSGLGEARSNLSSESYDEKVATWMADENDRIDSLLIARGYIVGVDPGLVTVGVKKLMPAISGLQLFLSIFPVFLAAAVWLGLRVTADADWSNTFLSNLVHSMAAASSPDPDRTNWKPGYMRKPPNIEMQALGPRLVMIDGQPVVLARAPSAGSGISKRENMDGGKGGFKTDSRELEEHDEPVGRERLLSYSV